MFTRWLKPLLKRRKKEKEDLKAPEAASKTMGWADQFLRRMPDKRDYRFLIGESDRTFFVGGFEADGMVMQLTPEKDKAMRFPSLDSAFQFCFDFKVDNRFAVFEESETDGRA